MLVSDFTHSQKLDSAVMHVSCIQAGTFLARLRRPEFQHCVAGLEQYSYAYEECADQAAEIKRIYAQAVAGEVELSHMASVFPGPAYASGEHQEGGGLSLNGSPQQHSAMNVEPSTYGGSYHD